MFHGQDMMETGTCIWRWMYSEKSTHTFFLFILTAQGKSKTIPEEVSIHNLHQWILVDCYIKKTVSLLFTSVSSCKFNLDLLKALTKHWLTFPSSLWRICYQALKHCLLSYSNTTAQNKIIIFSIQWSSVIFVYKGPNAKSPLFSHDYICYMSR